MAELIYNRRDDWSHSGFFAFKELGTKYADSGQENFIKRVEFEDAVKVDTEGVGTYRKDFEVSTARVYDEMKSDALDGGSSASTHQLIRRLRLPADFGRSQAAPHPPTADPYLGLFPSGALSLMTYKSATVYYVKAWLYNVGTPDPGVNGVDITPSVASTWQLKTLTPTAVYSAGQVLTLILQLRVGSVGVYARLADLLLAYRSALGNV